MVIIQVLKKFMSTPLTLMCFGRWSSVFIAVLFLFLLLAVLFSNAVIQLSPSNPSSSGAPVNFMSSFPTSMNVHFGLPLGFLYIRTSASFCLHIDHPLSIPVHTILCCHLFYPSISVILLIQYFFYLPTTPLTSVNMAHLCPYPS